MTKFPSLPLIRLVQSCRTDLLYGSLSLCDVPQCSLLPSTRYHQIIIFAIRFKTALGFLICIPMLEEWQVEGIPDFEGWNFQVKPFSSTSDREELIPLSSLLSKSCFRSATRYLTVIDFSAHAYFKSQEMRGRYSAWRVSRHITEKTCRSGRSHRRSSFNNY